MHKTRIVAVALALTMAACGGTSETTSTQAGSTAAPASTTSSTAAPAPETTAVDTTAVDTTAVDITTAPVGTPMSMAGLQLAMEKAATEPPARIEGLIEMVGIDPDVGAMDISIPFTSAYDAVTGDGMMMMDFSSMADLLAAEAPEMAGFFGDFEMRQVGDTAYLKFGMINMMFGVETEWLSMPVEDGEGFAEGFTSGLNAFDATELLDSLSATDGDLREVGKEDIRGVETTHYQVFFDLESLEALDPDAFEELQDSGPLPVDELPMDLWIDGQGRIHRYLFEVEGADLGDPAATEEFDYMRVQFDFSDYGGRVTIEPPPADQVTDSAELGAMFGGFDA